MSEQHERTAALSTASGWTVPGAALLCRAVEGMSESCIVLDRELRCLFENGRAAALLGAPTRDGAGHTPWEQRPALFGPATERACRLAAANGTAQRVQHTDAASGRCFEHRIEPATEGLIIFSAEIRARSQQQRFTDVLHTLEDVVLLVDHGFRLLQLNARAQEAITGHGELIGQPIWSVLPWLEASEAGALLRRVMLERKPGSCERRGVRSGRWYVTTFYPVNDGALMVSRDVHDQKQAEQRLAQQQELLHESGERFRHLAESMPQIVWTTAPDGTMTFVNHQWTKLTGLDLADSNDPQLLAAVFHPADAERVFERWSQALATGEPHEVQWRMKRKSDGSYRWCLSRAVPVRDAQGVVREWFGTATDIHEQKLAEEALRDADRRKDEFLATLAHELRNPLSPLASGLQLLREPADAASQQHVLDVMERQLGHMVRLIDDLLDINRITHNKLELRTEPLQLAAVLHAAIDSTRALFSAMQHSLQVELPHEPVALQGDATRLCQVFDNLLTNAAKYTPRGGRIELSAAVSGEHVEVHVRDNGIGVAPEHLPQLFEMFSQFAPALERSQGGLGIGLSLARSLVALHGGSIACTSAGAGQGSEFVVRLPIARHGAPEVDVPVARAQAPARRYRVLVADDLHDAAELLALVLRRQGHEVHVAYDGIAALELAREHRPEVMLLDIGMPGLNGYETARAVRKEPWGAQPLLVAITGWGQEHDKREASAAGFDRHLTKPVDAAALQGLWTDLARA